MSFSCSAQQVQRGLYVRNDNTLLLLLLFLGPIRRIIGDVSVVDSLEEGEAEEEDELHVGS